jgi:flagellar biosynthesis protein FlhB
MSDDRTEEPTPKKLADARKRGEVWKSRDAASAAVILGAGGALVASGRSALDELRAVFSLSLRAAAGEVSASPGALLEAAAAHGAAAVAPALAAATIAGTLVTFLQVGPLLSTEAVSFKPERLDPVTGLRNLFAPRQVLELLKSLLKMIVIGWVLWTCLRDGVRGALSLVGRDAGAALATAGALVSTLLLRAGGALAALAVLDVLHQRWLWRERLKMTKEEVKREYKDSEGDPHAKAERERVRQEILEHSVLERVRTADVLVVNPTHYAVALRYDEEGGVDVPEVLAKGMDGLARRMIEAAREAGVPVVRDVPLARALHELEVGAEIPESLFDAVAAVLAIAWQERAEADGGGSAGGMGAPGGPVGSRGGR